ncbi:MAG: UDP-N-acetylmuramoyl-tripeptide--D-alanyl-D-alanine ligase [Spirochaetes bacterium]|nr:UDP-N-acetylmuramoyl-tripeptide--D-alanyl-D-alanine ligase [Spirochaetota bacterium]
MGRVLFQFSEIVRIVGGSPYYLPLTEQGGITSVISDSRQASRGCLFVPLKGERTDGHYYIQEVFSKGGKASFVALEFWNQSRDSLQSYAVKYRGAYVIVPSPLEALHKLAEGYLRKKKVHRIGVTGSNGKTTTKEILGTILSQSSSTFMNRGNLNSEIGLPLSVFEVQDDHRWAVFEMGMNHPGEIQALAQIVKPEIGILTNIGTAHIGNLGSQEAIAAEKKQLLLSLPSGGVGFIHEDEAFAPFLKEGVKARIQTFGERTTPGYGGAKNLGLKGWEMYLEGRRIRFPLIGRFNLRNALAAIAVCKELGVGISEIQMGLESVKPLFGRSQIIEGPITILLDCYNANPNSMQEALNFFHEIEWSGRRVGVFGSMKELGSYEGEAHRTLGEWILQKKLDGVFLYGEAMETVYQMLQSSAHRVPVFLEQRIEVLATKLKEFLKEGDLVLIKGSRSLELERVVSYIVPHPTEGDHA